MKERRSASTNLNPAAARKRQTIASLNKPLSKPPVMYSERDNNRDTFLIKGPTNDDKIHVHSAASQLFDKPPQAAAPPKPKPTVQSLRERAVQKKE